MKLTYPSILKFQQLVELKDYRPATKKEYLRYVCKLAEHFQCDPATLTENQLRQYFLFLRQHKHYKAAPMKAAKYSLLCFYLDCVQVTGWTVFKEVRIAEPQVLPLVLSRTEVQSLLAALTEPRFRTCLRLMYHCGLRVGETVSIQVSDIHGRVAPPRLHIRNGKGGKDRFGPLLPLAEVLRRHWPAYERKFRARLLPSHRRAVTAILACRTPALGGQLYRCECGKQHLAYHSCNHRACPQCGHADATQWLERQRRRLLPVPYYLVTFTVPEPLRRLIRSHQKIFYALLLRESAGALLEVGRDHKELGAQLGLLAVLQTWARDLHFHPHVHCVVPGGGLSQEGLRWVRPKRPDYFLPQAALAMRFRTRFKHLLQQEHPQLFVQIPRQVWKIHWVADVQPVGRGEPALKYLAAYVYRTAFSAQRIVADDGEHVTFSYRDNQGQPHQLKLSGEKFLHRFLQHVLLKGFQRVRSFGWLSPAAKQRFARVRALLDSPAPPPTPATPKALPPCPCCQKPMYFIGRLPRAPP